MLRRLHPRTLGPASILVLILGIPSVALAITIMSEGGFIWDPQETFDGGLSNGSIDAYDGCYSLTVNDIGYGAGGMGATLDLGGRMVTMAEVPSGSLMVQRTFYVPMTGGDWGRYVDLIRNPTAA